MSAIKQKYERMKKSLAKAREVAEETVYELRRDAEILFAAGAMGYARGHYEGQGKSFVIGKKAQVSPELVVGLPLKLLGYTGVGGKASADFHALGIGPLAFRLGTVARDKASKSATDASASGGTTPATKGAPGQMHGPSADSIMAQLRKRAEERAQRGA